MWLLLIFLAIPIVEIALFIQVGGMIGLWPTLGLVILTAVAGVALIRMQGLQAMRRLRTSLEAGGDPTGPIADGAMILGAGVLLLVPGFFTDLLGLVLLAPATRAAVLRGAAARLKTRGAVFAGTAGVQRRSRGDTIEGEFEVLDDVPPAQRGASGWTRPQR
jgi:UPF0716 protein FxsA